MRVLILESLVVYQWALIYKQKLITKQKNVLFSINAPKLRVGLLCKRQNINNNIFKYYLENYSTKIIPRINLLNRVKGRIKTEFNELPPIKPTSSKAACSIKSGRKEYNIGIGIFKLRGRGAYL